MTLTGSGFAGASVTLDHNPISATPISATQIRLTMPAHDSGYALIQVAAGGASSAAEFLYVPPRLQEISPGSITTVAGVGKYGRFHLSARLSPIVPWSLAFDKAGGLLVASSAAGQVLRVAPDGTLQPFAGQFPQDGVSVGDGGPATEARLTIPRGVGVDGNDNVYVPDGDNRIRRIDGKTRVITTIAGTGEAGFSGDGGPALAARINDPSFLAVRSDGTVYFIDHGNYRIRRISTTGIISTVAGTGVPGESGDGGPATSAQIDVGFSDVGALAVAPNGDLFLLETERGRLRKIDAATGIISTFLDKNPHGEPLQFPDALTVDAAGNVYCSTGGSIVEVDPSGRLLDFWGAGGGFSEDGTPARQALLGNPRGLAVDDAGNILYSEEQVQRVRRINRTTGLIETVAGIGPAVLGVPGPAVGALFNPGFGDVAVLPDGTLLVGSDDDRRIFSVDSSGRIDFFAGSGWTYNEEGRALETSVIPKGGMDVDSAGSVYFADTTRIGRIGPDGFVRSISGGSQWGFGGCGYDGDGGPAVSASLCQPWDVVLDSQGNAFIADTNNNRIRRIDAKSGIITTIAGTGPSSGFENYGHGTFCGDGGPAVAACLNSPFALAVEPDGTIYVVDIGNGRLRKIDPGGVISTFLETGPGYGPRILADGYGGLFLVVSSTLARLLPDGTSWTIAGTVESGFTGDGGPAREARISSGYATTIDAEGNLFFLDIGNKRVRAVRYGALMAPPDAAIEATAAGSTIRTTVRAANRRPIAGVRVDFTAPASGPSCRFQNGAGAIGVITDANGVATTSCVPKCAGGGSFAVTARPLTATASARVTMFAPSGPCHRRAVRH